MVNIPQLRAVLITTQTPEVPYYYYELVTNVIRAVKIKFCHTRGIRSDIPRLSTNQYSVLKPPSS